MKIEWTLKKRILAKMENLNKEKTIKDWVEFWESYYLRNKEFFVKNKINFYILQSKDVNNLQKKEDGIEKTRLWLQCKNCAIQFEIWDIDNLDKSIKFLESIYK